MPTDLPPAIPTHWRPQRLLNPRADVIERSTLAWLATYGIGFTLWESTAERYQELKASVGGKPLIAPVVAVRAAV